MVDESISLSESEFAFLRALQNNKVEFVIVGMSAALLHGIPAVTQDVDLWVKNLGSKEFLVAISEVGASYIPPGLVGTNPPMLAGSGLRGFDLVTSCHGLGSIDEELRGASVVKIRDLSIKILPLEKIIKSKEAVSREKDLAVLPMLRAALAAKNKA